VVQTSYTFLAEGRVLLWHYTPTGECRGINCTHLTSIRLPGCSQHSYI